MCFLVQKKHLSKILWRFQNITTLFKGYCRIEKIIVFLSLSIYSRLIQIHSRWIQILQRQQRSKTPFSYTDEDRRKNTCKKYVFYIRKFTNFCLWDLLGGSYRHPQIHRKHRKHTSKKYMSVCLTSVSCQQKKTLASSKKHKYINITFLVPLQEKN